MYVDIIYVSIDHRNTMISFSILECDVNQRVILVNLKLFSELVHGNESNMRRRDRLVEKRKQIIEMCCPLVIITSK